MYVWRIRIRRRQEDRRKEPKEWGEGRKTGRQKKKRRKEKRGLPLGEAG